MIPANKIFGDIKRRFGSDPVLSSGRDENSTGLQNLYLSHKERVHLTQPAMGMYTYRMNVSLTLYFFLFPCIQTDIWPVKYQMIMLFTLGATLPLQLGYLESFHHALVIVKCQVAKSGITTAHRDGPCAASTRS